MLGGGYLGLVKFLRFWGANIVPVDVDVVDRRGVDVTYIHSFALHAKHAILCEKKFLILLKLVGYSSLGQVL